VGAESPVQMVVPAASCPLETTAVVQCLPYVILRKTLYVC